MTDWIPAKDAAGRLGCHPSHIRRLCARDRLRAYKLGNQWYVHISGLGSQVSPKELQPGDIAFPYLSASELCQQLGLSKCAVRRRIKLGELEGAFKSPFRAWTIPRSSVPAALTVVK